MPAASASSAASGHHLRFAARTDRGLLRSNNQDSVYAGERLLIVADGMGGHAAGDLASRVVVAAFAPLDEQPPGFDLMAPLRRAMEDGNQAIADMVAQEPDLDGMGTTATAMLFDGPRMGLAHIGDSRAYLYRNGVLRQLSHDDTFVQSLVDDGRITEDEAAHHPQRNLLLRALNGSEPEPMLAMREISVGDRFLLCSDGLSGVVSPEAIADTLAGPDTDRVADTLIELALIGGGPDNVTVIVADVLDVGPELVNIPPGYDPDDPEATGPILPIHMTQRMPRVPLPVLSDEEAAERAEEQRAAEQAMAGPEDDDDDSGLSGPPDRPRWGRRTAFALALVVLLAVGATASVLWVRTQYYVGQNNGQVVVFRGVDGSLLGVDLSAVEENSCPADSAGCAPLLVSDLVPAARDQVAVGIPATSLVDARIVMQRLTGQMLPLCTTAPPSTTVSSPSTTSSPTSPSSTSSPSTTSSRTATSSPTTSNPTTTASRSGTTSGTTGRSTGTSPRTPPTSTAAAGGAGSAPNPAPRSTTTASTTPSSTTPATTTSTSTSRTSTSTSTTPTTLPTTLTTLSPAQIPGVTCR